MSDELTHSPESEAGDPAASPFIPLVDPEPEVEALLEARPDAEPDATPELEDMPASSRSSPPGGGPKLPKCAILSSFCWNNGGPQGWAMGLQRSASVYGSLPAWLLVAGLVAVSVGSFMVGSALGISVAVDLRDVVLDGQ